jgi:hypothetical protein
VTSVEPRIHTFPSTFSTPVLARPSFMELAIQPLDLREMSEPLQVLDIFLERIHSDICNYYKESLPRSGLFLGNYYKEILPRSGLFLGNYYKEILPRSGLFLGK